MLRAAGEIEQLNAEKLALSAQAAAEREQMALQLSSDNRELRRLRNRVLQLEGEDRHALKVQLAHARLALASQEKVQADVDRRAASIAAQLQAARDQSVTDLISRQRADERAAALLKAASRKVAEMRAGKWRLRGGELTPRARRGCELSVQRRLRSSAATWLRLGIHCQAAGAGNRAQAAAGEIDPHFDSSLRGA